MRLVDEPSTAAQRPVRGRAAVRRRRRQDDRPEEPGPCPCAAGAIAQIVSVLRECPLRESELLRKAIGLGLLRPGQPEDSILLTAETANRLLLAGYQLPAHFEQGRLAALPPHLEAGRHVLVILVPALLGDVPGLSRETPPALDDAVRSAQVTHFATVGEQPFVCLSWPGGETFAVTAARFSAAWAAAGCPLIVAARGWDELCKGEPTFFGGHRNGDGTYFWTTAGYDTDARGRILRVV
jgi:hypothetical protein